MQAPAWFRYGVIAMATLMLCSCKATTPGGMAARNADDNGAVRAQQLATAKGQARQFDPDVMPVVYREDPHTPPPAIRRAEYAAGIRAACPCGDHGCAPSTAGCQCSNDCPLVGPRDEYLCDGGDQGFAVGIHEDWRVEGLEQEDTVAHYDTIEGQTLVTPSNQVCIYAPRFGVVRRMVDLHEYTRADRPDEYDAPLSLSKIDENERANTSLNQVEPSIDRADDPANLVREQQKLGELDRDLVVEEYAGTLAAYADLQIIRAGTISNNEKALLARASLAAITWSGDQSPHVAIDERHAQAAIRDSQPGIVYHLHDPKKPELRLIKLASCGAAKPGDEVEFTLRFDNIGSQVMGNVTIMDNLTTRLEYVDGSATSSVEADFSTSPNEGGSLVLRWEIKEPLEAGKGGILQFKCRVR